MEDEAGSLFRLVRENPDLTLEEIDRHMQGLSRQQQLERLSYQHPSSDHNVFMYMVANEQNTKEKIKYLIDRFLSIYKHRLYPADNHHA